MYRAFLLLLFLCSFTGVVHAQDTPVGNGGDGKTILIVNAMPSEISNWHLGLTIFSNYDKKLENDWGVPARTEARLVSRLESAGYRVVHLDLADDRADEIRRGDYIKAGWSKLKLAPTFAAWLWSEMDKAGVDEALVLSTYSRKFDFNVPASYAGYGVVSTAGKIPVRAYLFANVSLRRLHRGQVELPARAKPLDMDCRIDFDPKSLGVSDYSNLSAADLASLRSPLEGMINKILEQEIVAVGLTAGEPERCQQEKIP